MGSGLARYGPLAVAAGMLGTGAIELSNDGNPLAGTMLASAGLITFGSWLAVDLYHSFHHHHHEHDEDEHSEDEHEEKT